MMRKIILILTVLIAASCHKEEDYKNEGKNPLSDCVVSETVQPGKEAIVQWNGFGADPELVLRDADGNEYSLTVTVVTSSGLIFVVPSEIGGGMYTLILKLQNEIQVLGEIEVLAADIPVSGLKFPVVVEPGSDFMMDGIGFTDDMKVILKNVSGQIVLDCSLVQSSLKVEVPSGISSGTYSLYISDGNYQWLVSESFLVSVRKVLHSVSMLTPAYGNISYKVMYEVEREGDDVNAIVFTASQMEGDKVIAEESRDRYVLGSDGIFRAEGGVSTSNNIDFGYNYDADGRILSSDVRRYSRTDPEGTMKTFDYEYNADGTPSRITYLLDGKTRSMQMWFYEKGNIVEMKASTIFVYEDESLKNHPFAPDLAMAYAALSDTMEPFIYAPYLIGKHPFTSALLPSSISIDQGYGTKNSVDMAYTYDEDGYVIEAELKGTSTFMKFTYNINL